MRDRVLLMIAVLSFIACHDEPRSERDAGGVSAAVLTGDLINQAPVIGHPYNAEVAGRSLWVVDAAGNPALHALDAVSGELIRSVARKGGGPGEVNAIANVHADPSDRAAVWAFDGSRQRLVRFALGDTAHNRPTISMPGAPLFFKAVWLDAQTGVGVANQPERRFTLFDASGAAIRSIPGELLGSDTIPLEARQRATVTRFSLCRRPTGTHFAIAYGDAGRIDIHDAGLSTMIPASVPEPADPVLERDERKSTIRWRRHALRYISCTATTEHLFALYSGKVFSDRSVGSDARHATDVHVFDWTGQLVRTLRLEPAVSGIGVDRTGETLYGVALSDAAVYRYRVPRVSTTEPTP